MRKSTKFEKNGFSVMLRSLKGKEVKKLRKEKKDLMSSTAASMPDCVEATLNLVLSKTDIETLDDQDYSLSLEVFEKINELTYGSVVESKNS
jgi:hypothetical protein